MALSLNDLYSLYSVRKFARKIEVKRLKIDGSYESTWQNVEELSGLKLLDDSVPAINYSLSDSTYSFGAVTVGNVVIKLNSKNGQFDDENNSGSIFKGYVRHKSLIRIRDGYLDYYTDSSNPVEVLNTVFEGFIDDTSTSTKVDDENLLQNIQCVDKLSFLLKNYTLADVKPLSSTTLKDLIFEILNRSIFTQFFTVDITKIIPGVNILNLDINQYEGQTQLYSIFENLSIGHSYFQLRDNFFVYKLINTPGSSSTSNMTFDNKKTIKFSAYSSGIDKVIEKIYWQDDPSTVYTSPTNKYNKTKTIEIKAVTDFAQRQLVVNAIGNITRFARKEFTIEVPYCMFVNILDEIIVESPQIIPSDAFIWGISNWGEARWRRSLQADSIPAKASWLVTKINHSGYKTKIIAREI